MAPPLRDDLLAAPPPVHRGAGHAGGGLPAADGGDLPADAAGDGGDLRRSPQAGGTGRGGDPATAFGCRAHGAGVRHRGGRRRRRLRLSHPGQCCRRPAGLQLRSFGAPALPAATGLHGGDGARRSVAGLHRGRQGRGGASGPAHGGARRPGLRRCDATAHDVAAADGPDRAGAGLRAAPRHRAAGQGDGRAGPAPRRLARRAGRSAAADRAAPPGGCHQQPDATAGQRAGWPAHLRRRRGARAAHAGGRTAPATAAAGARGRSCGAAAVPGRTAWRHRPLAAPDRATAGAVAQRRRRHADGECTR